MEDILAYAAIALTLLPIVGLLLWIIKTALKVSFSVIKVLAVLFVVWFIYAVISGGVWQAIDGIGGPSIEQQGDGYTVNAAFSDGVFDLSGGVARVTDVRVNGVASKLKVLLPANTMASIKYTGVALRTDAGGEEEFSLVDRGAEAYEYGSGTNVVYIEVVAAFCEIELEFAAGSI